MRSFKCDANGNIIAISGQPAAESGEGFIDFEYDLPDYVIEKSTICVDGKLVVRPEPITEFYDYVNGNWVLNTRRQTLHEIQMLEAEITPRRLREAILGDTAWLQEQERLIALKRSQL